MDQVSYEEEDVKGSQQYEGDGGDEQQDISFTEYDISAAPNDFNVRTLFDFIDSGVVKIPGFQRNYVWDIKRASKLIESLLIGIPIPQIFLYQEEKNKFLVIDGQQRYFTIYFFKHGRFPRKEKRFELRKIFDESKGIPQDTFQNNEFFTDFKLHLPEQLPNKPNKFNGLKYETLSEADRDAFDIRTIRNIIIKQTSPDNDDSVVFEIFNRLNSGGVNLKPQEIRTSLYHSNFYEMLYRINLDPNWRSLTPQVTPDLNMKDVEILLRGFAMLIHHNAYAPSLTKFLNWFSAQAKKFSDQDIEYFEQLFVRFTEKAASVDSKIFFTKGGRFNISVYESIFVALCEEAFGKRNISIRETNVDRVADLKANEQFYDATISNTASTANVMLRIKKAKELL